MPRPRPRPIHVGVAGRDHVFSTFSTERKKIGDETLITYSKAAITTALILTTETITTVSNYIAAKKEDAKAAVDREGQQLKLLQLYRHPARDIGSID